MKVGIITFHRALNYGANLQAYALIRIISKMNVDANVVDYYCEEIEKMYTCFNVKTARNAILSFVNIISSMKKRLCYNDFRERFLNLTNVKYTAKSINQINNMFDIFITGSDQVWNYKGSNFDKNFFLDFVLDSRKKNSYAASFGLEDIPNSLCNQYEYLLNDFNNISVREKTGADTILKLLNKTVPVVLDPTLLLKKEEWLVFDNNKYKHKKYILVYSFGSHSLDSFAQRLSERYDLPIWKIDGSIKSVLNHKKKSLRGLSPQDWVALFINASYVVTNSFHGTAFAINFNKCFFTELLLGDSKVNTRLENILDLFNLRSQQIIENDTLSMNTDINFDRVNKILNIEREKSLSYLRNIIEDKNE